MTGITTEEILPCPSCGNSNSDNFMRGINYIFCAQCNLRTYMCMSSLEIKPTHKNELIKQWNKMIKLYNESKESDK